MKQFSPSRALPALSTGSLYLHRCKRLLMLSRRRVYGLRALVPGLRERHRMEVMVGPLGFWSELQRYQLNTLKVHGLEPHHSLLDIGCGPLQGGTAFIDYLDKGNYTGVDKSARPLGAAYAQIARCSLQHKNPKLVHSETLGREELGDTRYDYIVALQILYHFDADGISAMFQAVSKRLKATGVFLGDVLGPKHYQNRYPEKGYYIHGLDFLRNVSGATGMQLSESGEIERYGYPSALSLKSNVLLTLRPRALGRASA